MPFLWSAECSNCAKEPYHLNVATNELYHKCTFYICAKYSRFKHPFLQLFFTTWVKPLPFLQTSTIRIYLGFGMWSTDTFWSPPDWSDTPLTSEHCRKAIGPRGQRSSTPGSKCVLRKPWRRSSAATEPITNSEVKKKEKKKLCHHCPQTINYFMFNCAWVKWTLWI